MKKACDVQLQTAITTTPKQLRMFMQETLLRPLHVTSSQHPSLVSWKAVHALEWEMLDPSPLRTVTHVCEVVFTKSPSDPVEHWYLTVGDRWRLTQFWLQLLDRPPHSEQLPYALQCFLDSVPNGMRSHLYTGWERTAPPHGLGSLALPAIELNALRRRPGTVIRDRTECRRIFATGMDQDMLRMCVYLVAQRIAADVGHEHHDDGITASRIREGVYRTLRALIHGERIDERHSAHPAFDTLKEFAVWLQRFFLAVKIRSDSIDEMVAHQDPFLSFLTDLWRYLSPLLPLLPELKRADTPEHYVYLPLERSTCLDAREFLADNCYWSLPAAALDASLDSAAAVSVHHACAREVATLLSDVSPTTQLLFSAGYPERTVILRSLRSVAWEDAWPAYVTAGLAATRGEEGARQPLVLGLELAFALLHWRTTPTDPTMSVLRRSQLAYGASRAASLWKAFLLVLCDTKAVIAPETTERLRTMHSWFHLLLPVLHLYPATVVVKLLHACVAFALWHATHPHVPPRVHDALFKAAGVPTGALSAKECEQLLVKAVVDFKDRPDKQDQLTLEQEVVLQQLSYDEQVLRASAIEKNIPAWFFQLPLDCVRPFASATERHNTGGMLVGARNEALPQRLRNLAFLCLTLEQTLRCTPARMSDEWVTKAARKWADTNGFLALPLVYEEHTRAPYFSHSHLPVVRWKSTDGIVSSRLLDILRRNDDPVEMESIERNEPGMTLDDIAAEHRRKMAPAAATTRRYIQPGSSSPIYPPAGAGDIFADEECTGMDWREG